MSLLELEGVTRSFESRSGTVPAVRGIDLSLGRAETLGLVGESGCGKTTLARVVAGLSQPTQGKITFDGVDLVEKLAAPDFRRRVQMVFQHPGRSLNPRFSVRRTVSEPLRQLELASGPDLDDRVDEVLRLVGLGREYLDRRPADMSGGQQQRVAIARAVICEPDLLVLDEPTSSLDQSIQSRILSLLKDIQRRTDVAYLFISHDLTTVRRIADRVAVMYLGRVVELSDTRTIFESPQHPYTRALLSAVPSMDPRADRRRDILPGETPNPRDLPVGCSFQSRCPLVHERCRVEYPRLEPYERGHLVECFAVPVASPVRAER